MSFRRYNVIVLTMISRGYITETLKVDRRIVVIYGFYSAISWLLGRKMYNISRDYDTLLV